MFTVAEEIDEDLLNSLFLRSIRCCYWRGWYFITAVDGDLGYLSLMKTRLKFVLKKDALLIRGEEISIFMGNINATKVFLITA